MKKLLYIVILFSLLLVIIGSAGYRLSFKHIGNGDIGIKTHLGAIKEVMVKPGEYFSVPFIENIETFKKHETIEIGK